MTHRKPDRPSRLLAHIATLILLTFGLGCGLADCVASFIDPPTTKPVTPADVAQTITRTCQGQKVTLHFNADATFEIKRPPLYTSSGTWTIEQARITLHYEKPRQHKQTTSWYITDDPKGGFGLVDFADDPDDCYWLLEP